MKQAIKLWPAAVNKVAVGGMRRKRRGAGPPRTPWAAAAGAGAGARGRNRTPAGRFCPSRSPLWLSLEMPPD